MFAPNGEPFKAIYIHYIQDLPRGICSLRQTGLAAQLKGSLCSCNNHFHISWPSLWRYVFCLVSQGHGGHPIWFWTSSASFSNLQEWEGRSSTLPGIQKGWPDKQVGRIYKSSFCQPASETVIALLLSVITSFNPTCKGSLKLLTDFFMPWCMCSSMMSHPVPWDISLY